jgi:hypothetical protein
MILNRCNPMFNQLKLLKGLLLAFLVLTANISYAALLYQQEVIDPVDGFQADNSGVFFNGDDFSVASGIDLESISWWGAYFTENSDQFSVKIFDSLTDTPASVTDLTGTVTRSSALFDSNQQEYYLYQFTLSSPLELLAGDYFLSVHNTGDSEWVWLFGNTANGLTIYTDDANSDWNEDSSGSDMAFRLEGNQIQAVPESNTMLLLLLGYGGFAMVRRRIKGVGSVCMVS